MEFPEGVLAVSESSNNGIFADSYTSLEQVCSFGAFSTVDEDSFKAFHIEESWEFTITAVGIEGIFGELWGYHIESNLILPSGDCSFCKDLDGLYLVYSH